MKKDALSVSPRHHRIHDVSQKHRLIRLFTQICPRFWKTRRRVLSFALVTFLGLGSVLGVQTLFTERVIGASPLIQPILPTSDTTVRKPDGSVQPKAQSETLLVQTPIKINYQQLDQGQDDLASGRYTQACQTFLQGFGLESPDCQLSDQQLQTLHTLPNSPANVEGLRGLGEVLRRVGRLDDAQTVLSFISQPTPADYLSLGNTQRALSQRQRNLYNRTRNLDDLQQALNQAKIALDSYRTAAETDGSNSQIIPTQARLNQLSLTLDTVAWLKTVKQELTVETWIPTIKSEIAEVELAEKKWFSILENQASQTRQTIQPTLDPKIWEKLTSPEQLSLIYAQVNYGVSLTQLQKYANHFPFLIKPSTSEINQRFDTAVTWAKQLNNPEAEIYALGYYGQWYEQQQEWQKAEKQTEKALRLAQSQRLWDVAYPWQWQLGRIYKAEADQAGKQHKMPAVQGYFQSALTAYEAAFHNIQNIRDNLLSAELDIQFNLRDQVEPIYRGYVNLLLQSRGDNQQGNLEEARNVISELQLAELQNLLQCSVAQLEGEETVSLEAIIAEDSTTAVLYPILLEDRLEVILAVPGEKLRHYSPANTPRQEVETLIKRLRYSLEQPFFSQRGRQDSQTLYNWLIQPAEADLANSQVNTLIFVLDGALRNIPMAALLDENEQYLVEKYAIALSTGLRLPKSEPKGEFNALIAGLSKQPELADSPDNQFGQLDYVEIEVENIQAILQDAPLLFDEQFTDKALQEKINSSAYNLVHLATHGQFGFSREDTFIITAATEADQEINSKINALKIDLNTLDDLLRARNQDPIELLVLSACETATGDNRAVLGIAGMAVQTGARSTVATLWSIDDPSTAALMKQFYAALDKKTTKAEALRQAQLHLLRNPSAYRPSHWAAFVLVGDWR